MGSSHYKDDDCVRVIIYIYLAPRWDRLIIKMMTVGDYLHLLGAKMGSSHHKDDDYTVLG